MEGLFGEGLVDEVLFCCGDSLEEDLLWEPRLGGLVGLGFRFFFVVWSVFV